MDELSLLKKVDKKRNNVFFVINKIDKCDEDEIIDAEKQDQKVLDNAKISISRIYKISAKAALEGNKSGDFASLHNDIHDFLNANKVNLLCRVFVKRVLETATPLFQMLEARIAIKRQGFEDLEKMLEQWEKDSNAMKLKAEKITSSFDTHWTKMVDDFSSIIPEVEDKVQIRVKNTINNLPILSFTRKNLDTLPEIISTIIESELIEPIQIFEKQVNIELERVNTDFPSVSKYLSDANYRASIQKGMNSMRQSKASAGMALFSKEQLPIHGTDHPIRSLSGVPIVGGWLLGQAAGMLAFPLTALSLIGMTGGILLMALPVYGWIRGRSQQKKQVLDSARASIENAFLSIQRRDIPELRRKSAVFIEELNIRFEKDSLEIKSNILDAIKRKKALGKEMETESFKKDEVHLNELRNLLCDGEKILNVL